MTQPIDRFSLEEKNRIRAENGFPPLPEPVQQFSLEEKNRIRAEYGFDPLPTEAPPAIGPSRFQRPAGAIPIEGRSFAEISQAAPQLPTPGVDPVTRRALVEAGITDETGRLLEAGPADGRSSGDIIKQALGHIAGPFQTLGGAALDALKGVDIATQQRPFKSLRESGGQVIDVAIRPFEAMSEQTIDTINAIRTGQFDLANPFTAEKMRGFVTTPPFVEKSEEFRQRPMGEQIGLGLITDPLVLAALPRLLRSGGQAAFRGLGRGGQEVVEQAAPSVTRAAPVPQQLALSPGRPVTTAPQTTLLERAQRTPVTPTITREPFVSAPSAIPTPMTASELFDIRLVSRSGPDRYQVFYKGTNELVGPGSNILPLEDAQRVAENLARNPSYNLSIRPRVGSPPIGRTTTPQGAGIRALPQEGIPTQLTRGVPELTPQGIRRASEVTRPSVVRQRVDDVGIGQATDDVGRVADNFEQQNIRNKAASSNPTRAPASAAPGSNLPPPHRPEWALVDDLDFPKWEKTPQSLLRKWESARGFQGIGTEQWFLGGQKLARTLGIRQFNEETMAPVFRVLHGEVPVESLSPNLRRYHDYVKELRDLEQADMAHLLQQADSAGLDKRLRVDIETFGKQMMAHEDYFPRGWQAQTTPIPGGGLPTSPGFTQVRTDATFSEILASGRQPTSWDPLVMMAERRLAGMEFREAVMLVQRLKERGLVVPARAVAGEKGWRVPNIGAGFNGPAVPSPIANIRAGTVHAAHPMAVPNHVADLLERVYNRPFASIRYWTNALKGLKLFGSPFQHVDFLNRNLGAAFSPTGLRQGAPLRYPSLVGQILHTQFSPGARNRLIRSMLTNEPLGNTGIPKRMLVEEGLNLRGDISLIKREAADFTGAMESKFARATKAAHVGVVTKPIKAANDFFQKGLFEGTYNVSRLWALENFIVPWVRRTRTGATTRQIAAESVEIANIMFSSQGMWQNVFRSPMLREGAENLVFSINENEGLLRGMFRTLTRQPSSGLFREYYLGYFMALAGIAEGVHFWATGEHLPRKALIPFNKSPFSIIGVGYASEFLSPQFPGLEGQGGMPVYLDLMGQMDTAFRLASPFNFVSSRLNVPVRAFMNQANAESFYGEELDTPQKRVVQLLLDLGAPIGAGTLIGALVAKYPDANEVIPHGERRLGFTTQAAQATGFNFRSESFETILKDLYPTFWDKLSDNQRSYAFSLLSQELNAGKSIDVAKLKAGSIAFDRSKFKK